MSVDPAVGATAPRTPAVPPTVETPRWTHRQILDALHAVESNRGADPSDGDDGHAVGPYQIWEPYWCDAMEEVPSLAWIGAGASRRRARHADCRDAAYAEEVIGAYMLRYAPAAWIARDAETIARVHNGGPRGPRRASTAGYWASVQAALR